MPSEGHLQADLLNHLRRVIPDAVPGYVPNRMIQSVQEKGLLGWAAWMAAPASATELADGWVKLAEADRADLLVEAWVIHPDRRAFWTEHHLRGLVKICQDSVAAAGRVRGQLPVHVARIPGMEDHPEAKRALRKAGN